MRIYVAMHKIIDLNIPNCYERILVGSYNKKSENILRDDEKENISMKNQNYCELTALYWIWKNSKDDIVGLCHYRRFFSINWLSNNKRNFIDEKQIIKIFKKDGANIIVPKKIWGRENIANATEIAPNQNDLRILKEVICDLYPEYKKTFEIFMESKYAYLYNMIITKKEILNQYCEWLFKILFETEKRMNPNDYINDDYRKRMFGFLSERLFNIWIIHNKDKLVIREVNVVNTDENILTKIKGRLGNFLRKISR